jgi:hypothetical protein
MQRNSLISALCYISFFSFLGLLRRFDFSTAFAHVADLDRSSISNVDFSRTWRSGSRNLLCLSSQLSGDNYEEVINCELEEGTSRVISHPVLQQAYPLLRKHKMDFGHPNIPLGSKAGENFYLILADAELNILYSCSLC